MQERFLHLKGGCLPGSVVVVRMGMMRCPVVGSLATRRRVGSFVAQLPQHPQTETTGPLRFLVGFRFGFVATTYVVVLARPTLVVAAPRSLGHPTSMVPSLLRARS